MMEALNWIFFIFSLFSLLTKHSCQVSSDQNTKTLSPIILLPASSGISYEALQYPVPMDQYQLIPLVIHTGKIPLVNHAVQAPIQYFVPNGENQRGPRNEPALHSTAPAHDEYRPTTQRNPKPYSTARAENRPTNNNHPTTMHSETHVEDQQASRFSYGYKIINGNSKSQHETRSNGIQPGSHSPVEPNKSKRVPAHNASPGDESRTAVRERQRNTAADDLGKRDGSNPSKVLKPIVVKPSPKTTKTELRKLYKNVKNATKLETPINVTNENGILTTLRP